MLQVTYLNMEQISKSYKNLYYLNSCLCFLGVSLKKYSQFDFLVDYCQNKMSNRDQLIKQAMNEAGIAIQYDNNKQYPEAIQQYN